jgi:hypothetical protein
MQSSDSLEGPDLKPNIHFIYISRYYMTTLTSFQLFSGTSTVLPKCIIPPQLTRISTGPSSCSSAPAMAVSASACFNVLRSHGKVQIFWFSEIFSSCGGEDDGRIRRHKDAPASRRAFAHPRPTPDYSLVTPYFELE